MKVAPNRSSEQEGFGGIYGSPRNVRDSQFDHDNHASLTSVLSSAGWQSKKRPLQRGKRITLEQLSRSS
ncbi:hypothetical protein PYCC9005_001032 [Savitreella phatthalungensis]